MNLETISSADTFVLTCAALPQMVAIFIQCGCVDRKIALVIILTRAGLDLDPAALRRLRVTVPKLGLVPWMVECVVVAVMTHYLMDLPWIWGFLLGYIVYSC
jgi:NhaP-type Na+/H+ or K+/H+ antiporter